ncbi:MAG TPA: maltotransferase domain-containing protein, partial [Tepidiformaceae bacterium]|nr:maltotransferase domain-containing protein [Tepidiformaceae bacterium]
MSDPGDGPAPSCPATAPPRVAIESVEPIVDGGRFPLKRLVGDEVLISANIFTDGHDALAADLLYTTPGAGEPTAMPMRFLWNDRWEATIRLEKPGRHSFVVQGWIDSYGSWLEALGKRAGAGSVAPLDLLEGAELMRAAAANGSSQDALLHAARELTDAEPLRALAIAEEAAPLMRGAQERRSLVSTQSFAIDVDRERAGSGAWYELFPRSVGNGSFRAAEERLPYVASMGFDVLYLPPIHPIGVSHRKGPNNGLDAAPGDPGSPWAIGSRDGGHTAIEPGLGTFEDFGHFVETAGGHGLEVALDIAFQCSPDHPWVREHPSWFRHRADGSIAYAENPPKVYQDIVPLDFESEDWRALWAALRDVFLFWIGHGIKLFRVDNPHTKPFPFWDWLIASVREAHPDVVFLAEAFTRLAVMRRLAKAGFRQSYTYFTWRDDPRELAEYMRELS